MLNILTNEQYDTALAGSCIMIFINSYNDADCNRWLVLLAEVEANHNVCPICVVVYQNFKERANQSFIYSAPVLAFARDGAIVRTHYGGQSPSARTFMRSWFSSENNVFDSWTVAENP
jgi:hypothetical protein